MAFEISDCEEKEEVVEILNLSQVGRNASLVRGEENIERVQPSNEEAGEGARMRAEVNNGRKRNNKSRKRKEKERKRKEFEEEMEKKENIG